MDQSANSAALNSTSHRHGLLAIGALIAALTVATAFAFRAWGDNGYMATTIVAGLLVVVATRLAERAPGWQTLAVIFGVAAALRLGLLLTEPMLSTDIYRYIWDGRVQAAGINPYRFIPADPALSALRDQAIYPHIDKADYAVTIYPPIAQVFFLLVTRVSESVTMMKLAFVGCETVTAAVIWSLLKTLGKPVTRIVAYLWLPLPMWEIANNGHIDALMVALMMLGVWLALRERPRCGAVLAALGALAKPIAVFALPPMWRAWDWKMPAMVVAVLALCYVPYLSAGAGVLGFLTTGYLREESVMSGDTVWPLAAWRWLFGTLRGDVTAYWGASLLIVGGLAFSSSLRAARSPETVIADINKLLLAALLLFSPNYPWYFLALTPFVALRGGAAVWALCIAAVLLQEEAGWGVYVPILIRKTILYGSFIAACASVVRLAWMRRKSETEPPA